MAKRLLLFDVPSLVPALLKTALKPAGLLLRFRDVLQRIADATVKSLSIVQM